MNFEVELYSWLPFQGIYNLWLWLHWFTSGHEGLKAQGFIRFALRFLPQGSFIVFCFDKKTDQFVQLENSREEIVMNIPIWNTNAYYGKDSEILKVLKSQNLVRQYSKNEYFRPKTNSFALLPDWNEHNKQIKVNFGDDYIKASQVAFEIAEKVFKRSNPNLHKYVSDRLVMFG